MDVQKPPSISPRQLATLAIVAIQPLLLKPQRTNGLSERLLATRAAALRESGGPSQCARCAQ
jgi:hypothetical protein